MSIESARESFIAESRELISDMELALLECEQGNTSPATVNAIFRAAHTIKGNAGLFGFDAIVAFTHIVETALDQIRAGKIALNAEWAALLIECRDHMSALVDAIAAGGDGSDPQLSVWGKELVERLAALGAIALAPQAANDEAGMKTLLADAAQSIKGLLGARSADAVTAEILARIAAVVEREHEQVEQDSGPRATSDCWHVSLRCSPSVLQQGMDPLPFVRYLKTIGTIEQVALVADALPEPEVFDPEVHYIGYEIRLSGAKERQHIEEAFQFIREDSTLTVIAPRAPLAKYAKLMESLPEGTARARALLVEVGSLSEAEVVAALSPPTAAHEAVAASGAAADNGETRNAEPQSIRVDATKLERLINLVGELVIAGASATLLSQRAGMSELTEATFRMSRLVEDVRDQTLQLRMMQIGGTFARFSRVVRDVAKELGKDIRLETSGAETELDKTLIEKITDPLTHLVRNAIDHGIEQQALRLERGKPAQGIVRLNAYHDSGSVVIEVSDDGGGLSRDRILRKALERGLVTPGQQLSDPEVNALIFEAGFSTAEKVTNLSGRGVGMDVVKRNVAQLRGTVEMESREGVGTTVRVRLPLTLAIIDGFLVKVGGAAFVIPLELVEECVQPSQAAALLDTENRYVDLRGGLLSFVRLRELFGIAGKPTRRESIVVVRAGSQRAGFVVDELLGEHQTVIKPLARVFQHIPGLGGSTILGDGAVALILDMPALMEQCRARAGRRVVA